MISNNPIKIISVSDIHLGGKRNNTKNIIDNLKNKLIKDKSNIDYDIMFLAGDVFDTLLNLNSTDVFEIDYFIYELLKFCATNKIKLRVLEGTPSHDWTQSERFVTLSEILNIKDLDLLYVDNVHIEYMEDHNIHVLYVPDEIQPTPEKTLALVKQTMQAKGLSKVDIAVMHGQFEYQLPAHIKNIPRHSSEEYLNLVSKIIFIGHIHTHSTFDRIVAQGSFDRLQHGEEEPKGFVKAHIYKDKCEVFFIENEGAKIYKTIDCSNYDLEKSITVLRELAKNLPDKSAIRVSALSNHPIFSNMLELVVMAPHIAWTKRILDKDPDKNNTVTSIIENEQTYTPITLTKDNLVSLMVPRMILKLEGNEKLISRSTEMIKDAL